MADDRESGQDRPVPRTGLRTAGSSPHLTTSNGPNDRPLNETIAGTGPGIPDDALGQGRELPEPPSHEEIERAAQALGAPTASAGAREKLPLEGQ